MRCIYFFLALIGLYVVIVAITGGHAIELVRQICFFFKQVIAVIIQTAKEIAGAIFG